MYWKQNRGTILSEVPVCSMKKGTENGTRYVMHYLMHGIQSSTNAIEGIYLLAICLTACLLTYNM
jgi:hypothetical protein